MFSFSPTNSGLSSDGGTDLQLKAMIEDSHRMLTALFSIQGESVLLDALSTDSEREAHHLDFETNVSVSYGCINTLTHPNMLRCVVTNQFHPQKIVCKGAHLLAITEKHAMPLVGLRKCDIWDARNGLCVLRTIDKRFESKELVSIVTQFMFVLKYYYHFQSVCCVACLRRCTCHWLAILTHTASRSCTTI